MLPHAVFVRAVSLYAAAMCAACGAAATPPVVEPTAQSSSGPADLASEQHETHPAESPPSSATPEQALLDAEAHASPGPARVLAATRAMIDEGDVVRGSCWDWVEAVFRRAGGQPETVFRGRRTGPYADAAVMQAGDWMYFINHEWGEGTHSAIFVAWVDPDAHVALMVSYAGGHSDSPGRYGEYVLTSVYHVTRMAD